MRTNRLAIYILTPLTIISLALAIFLRNCNDFVSNVFLSIFGSSLLSLIIAIINYFNERKNVLYNLYNSCVWFLGYYYKIIRFETGDNRNVFDLRDCIDEWMKYYNSNVYTNISQALTVNKKSKLYRIVNELCNSVSKVYLAICEDNYLILKTVISDEQIEKKPSITLTCGNKETKEEIDSIIKSHKKLGEYLHIKQTQEENTDAD